MLSAVFFPLDSLLAGIPQKVKFTVTTGHYTVKNGDSLQLSNVEAMLILCHAENKAVIYSNTRGKGWSPSKGGLSALFAVHHEGVRSCHPFHPQLAPEACFCLQLSPGSILPGVGSAPAPGWGVIYGKDKQSCACAHCQVVLTLLGLRMQRGPVLNSDTLRASSLLQPSPLSSPKSKSKSASLGSGQSVPPVLSCELWREGRCSLSRREHVVQGHTQCSSVFRLSTMTALWPGTSWLSCSVTLS